MVQRPLSFSNLKDETTPQFFASYAEVKLKHREGSPYVVLETLAEILSFWEDYYDDCLKNGEFAVAQRDEPWLLTLRVLFLDRRQSRDKRRWVEIDIVTPYLLELLDTTGLGILSSQALAMLPPDMRAYLERDREEDAPSWFEDIEAALQAQE